MIVEVASRMVFINLGSDGLRSIAGFKEFLKSMTNPLDRLPAKKEVRRQLQSEDPELKLF